METRDLNSLLRTTRARNRIEDAATPPVFATLHTHDIFFFWEFWSWTKACHWAQKNFIIIPLLTGQE